MSPYIVNLTNHLIGKNRFDGVFGQIGHCIDGLDDFVKHVKIDLLHGDVRDMSPETLGKIMCSFERGDVQTSSLNIGFSGDVGEMLRELVSLCLAYVIRDRLDRQSAADMGFPPYSRTARETATK